MKNTTPQPIYLVDYRPPAFLVKEINLCFNLHDTKTQVSSKIDIYRNPDAHEASKELVLNGERIQLLSIKIDGKPLLETDYCVDDKTLTIFSPPDSFILEIENQIDPLNNTALDGLYKSGAIFCTQNEPEGFRKITYFLDRSDVMAKYTTKIIADKTLYPILLSNGNEIGKGDLEGGRHWVEWQDPFLKPCYLFALVAGDLGCITDTFTTAGGRVIDLRIYCDKGNESKCHHAMQSLIKSMKWDEDVFHLEYDLDIYMVVAVDAFNMGAMENKGLNIFNTSCVLADTKTATDDNYARIETVIAHEYFHNWTGNRITCRDWFQLTLKEGLTVFRDQEFSADMHSRPLQRIDNVLSLRARQFPEDSGPTAHPIQPSSYIQINNFYTPTVYNKGAEVIRMIQTLIGDEAFKKGIAKYFELYDGQAVTVEEFVFSMEIASERKLTQFRRWYHQAGTPEVEVTFQYDQAKKTLALSVKQSCPPTADGGEKQPFHFPLSVALLQKDGKEVPLKIRGRKLERPILEITQQEETFVFEDVPEPVVPSINRNFSAPIKLHVSYSEQESLFLMAHDTDAFNRWEAGQKLASNLMLNMVKGLSLGKELSLDPEYIKAFGILLDDQTLENSLKAKALTLPSEASLAERQDIIDFDGNYLVRKFMRYKLAEIYQERFKKIYESLESSGPYHFDAESAGRRSLKNCCLSYLACLETPEVIEMSQQQFEKATNMTDQFAALSLLADIDCPQREKALEAFYSQWKHDTLVMNKWLTVQALSQLDDSLKKVKKLMSDPVFNIAIPNLVRSLIGSFTQNHIHFHSVDGIGYAFIADSIIQLDKLNPQVAASLSGAFRMFAKLDPVRKKAMKKELDRILAEPELSSHVYEIISKSLAWDS